jgi:uncharacterized membrane protein YfcA
VTAAFAIYLGVGAAAGLLAGLFGVGGGIVIVPLAALVLAREGVAREVVMHLALGTSMASICFTSISSAWAHHRRGAVAWDVVLRIVPGILAGTFLGSFVAAKLPTDVLKGIFAVFLFVVSAQLLSDRKPAPHREFPGWGGMFGAGGFIGAVSSFVGIGGGTLSVPFMLWCNLPVHRAVGTSAAIGFPIAVAGAAGYVVNGWGAPGLPPQTLGYVHLGALVGIVAASVVTAPLGARLAHTLPVARLKKGFALFLLVMAVRMAWSLRG